MIESSSYILCSHAWIDENKCVCVEELPKYQFVCDVTLDTVYSDTDMKYVKYREFRIHISGTRSRVTYLQGVQLVDTPYE